MIIGQVDYDLSLIEALDALLAESSVTKAAALAGTSRSRTYGLRRVDPVLPPPRRKLRRLPPTDSRRRRDDAASKGVLEPLVSAGKRVRDDDGQPIMVRRYSD